MSSHGQWLEPGDLTDAAKFRLFCFPFAGGNASLYRPWRGRLTRGVEVCPVLLPGRAARLNEPPLTSLTALAAAAAEALAPALDRPFALFGHSMGALVAYEVARHLEARHLPAPAILYVSACAAPAPHPAEEHLSALPDAEFLAGLKALGGTAPGILQHPELVALLMPMLRADFTAFDHYVPAPLAPLGCAVVAFAHSEDRHATARDMSGWGAFSAGRFRLNTIPGGHFFLKPAEELLLRHLDRDLGPLAQRGVGL